MTVFTRRGGPSLVALLLLACGVQTQGSVVSGTRSDALSAASRTKTITILHVNDSHSTLDAVGPKLDETKQTGLVGTIGGLTRAATIVGQYKAAAPESTLFLHAGDVFEGDLTFVPTAGVLELSILRDLGLDAFTLGNHEFDYGPDVLAKSLADAGYRTPSQVAGGAGRSAARPNTVAVLSANLVKPTEPHPLSSLVTGHVIRNVGGVRVGIFGLTTATDPMMQTKPFTVTGGDSQDALEGMKEIAMREIQALRSPQQPGGPADVVILLSHLGAELEHGLANALGGVLDVVVAGHDEFEETFEGPYEAGTTIVVRAGHFYQKVGKLDLTIQNRRIVDATHRLIPVVDTVDPVPEIAEAVQGIQSAISAELGFDAFGDMVAYVTNDMPYEWTSDMGPRRDLGLGDLAADALKAHFANAAKPARIGLTTSGFLNDKLYEGPIVANDLFRALPYGINPKMLDEEAPDAILPDPVLKVTMTGAQLYAGFEFAVTTGEIPQVSDGTFVCYDELASPAIQFIVLDGVPVLPDTTEYEIATNVFLIGAINQVFGEYFPQLGQIAIPEDFDPFLSQFAVLLEYASGKQLATPADARVLNTPDCAAFMQ